jgi:seryl-tRNA synthetase
MLDIRFIRENPQIVKEAVKNRGYDIDIDGFLKMDIDYREKLQEVEKLKHDRNVATDEINKLKKEGKDISKKIKEIKEIPEKIKKLDEEIKEIKEKIDEISLMMPNIPAKDIPIGIDAVQNKEVKKEGKIPVFKFKPKFHWEIGEDLNIIDIERSIKLAGSGFYIFKGLGARLERALINFMLDLHIKDGFKEICPPILVNKKTMTGTSQLPKFENDLYKTTEGMYLIPTAEVCLANMHQEETLNEDELPKRYCAATPCFRTEAGKHGTETRGIFRLHQFTKVELVTICNPDNSFDELEFLRAKAEKVLEKLKIPYRTLLLCSGDMSFASAKTYDIECWSPAQEKYLEVSSASNCTDFQARRMNTKFRTSEGNKYVHTLNASGLALPRLIISVLENYQQKDGSVKIPIALQPYMDGIKSIEIKKKK